MPRRARNDIESGIISGSWGCYIHMIPVEQEGTEVKKFPLWLLVFLLTLLAAGCAKKNADPLLAGEWELIEGSGDGRIVVEEDGGAFVGGEAVKWEIPEAGRLRITYANRRTADYQYAADEIFLSLTAESGQEARYVHPERYPGDAAEQERLAGIWTDGRLTMQFAADGTGTRYGWSGEADAGFGYAASGGLMRITFPGDPGQWAQYVFEAGGSLRLLFERAPDGGEAERALWKMASPDRISGDYTVLYDTPSLAERISRISFDGVGSCRVDDVYGGYQYFENGVVIINAGGRHLSVSVDASVPGFLTISETGLDHRYTAIAEDASLADAGALAALAGIWSDADGSRLLQITPEGIGRAIWEGYEGAVTFRATGEFLRVEPVDEPDRYFYLCVRKMGAVLYAAGSAQYPYGYTSWPALDRRY